MDSLSESFGSSSKDQNTMGSSDLAVNGRDRFFFRCVDQQVRTKGLGQL